LTSAHWKKFPQENVFEKSSPRDFSEENHLQLREGEAASAKKKRWLLYAAYLLEVRRETEGIEPERRHQSYGDSAVGASAPVTMRLTGWTKHTPVNHILEVDMVNAPAVSPGRSSALVPKPALHNRHPPSVAERRFPFGRVSWVR
jgi:hypothetical protein